MDIVQQPAAGGAVSNVLADPTASEFQPSISPDGTQMCFTRTTGTPASTRPRASGSRWRTGVGRWSCPETPELPATTAPGPDGTKIAYVQGTFSSGDLVMENSDLSLGLISLETTSMRFDGNPDWAPDGRPQCLDQTVDTEVDTPVTIQLLCADTGPEYERTTVRAFVNADPANGTIAEPDVVPELPASVTYTPNQGFTGTDTFSIRSFDQVAFGDRDGTVTVNVRAPAPDEPSNEFSFGKVKRNQRKGTAKLTVNVPGAGRLELEGTNKVKGREKRADSEGSVKLKVKPKGNAKRKLDDRGKAKVTARVTYTPDGGDPNTKSKRVKLKRR